MGKQNLKSRLKDIFQASWTLLGSHKNNSHHYTAHGTYKGYKITAQIMSQEGDTTRLYTNCRKKFHNGTKTTTTFKRHVSNIDEKGLCGVFKDFFSDVLKHIDSLEDE